MNKKFQQELEQVLVSAEVMIEDTQMYLDELNEFVSNIRKKAIIADRLIPLKEVEALTGLSKSTIYKCIHDGKFPKQIKISRRAVRWSLAEVIEWIKKQSSAQTRSGQDKETQ